MNAPGFDAQFLAASREAKLSTAQELFLQTVIRRLDPDSLLSHHASLQRGLSLDLPQALGAISSHLAMREPRAQTVHSLCASAGSAANRAKIDSKDHIGADVVSAVSVVKVGKDKNVLDKADLLSAQGSLVTIEARLPGYLQDVFTRVWERTSNGGAALASYAADEIAAAASMDDRDRVTLEQDLVRLFTDGGWTTADVFAVLLPQQRTFKHACVVLGASELTDLSMLAPGAAHLTGRSAVRPVWGAANPALTKWVNGLQIVGEGVVISLDVRACDRASAARRGQQAATELLDQYMAGHRVSVIELSPEALTCEEGSNRAAPLNLPSRSVSVARPLAGHWPEQLRSTMRMAHLSRATGAPLVSAALAWSAVEASGLGPADMKKLARVFALQSVRHQVAAAHVGVLHDVRARRSFWRSQLRKHRSASKQTSRQLDAMEAGNPGRDAVEAINRDHMAAVARAESTLEDVGVASKALATVERYCLTRHFAVLEDLNTWVDVLLPASDGESRLLQEAREALSTILDGASAIACEEVINWRARLNSPKQLATWLTEHESRFERLLISIYASRNMTMHSGVFATPGDAVLGRGAELVTDVLMEVLGNWYRHSRGGPGEPDLAPQVIRELAKRYEDLRSKMAKATGPAYELNLAYLTSPGASVGWDRPLRTRSVPLRRDGE